MLVFVTSVGCTTLEPQRHVFTDCRREKDMWYRIQLIILLYGSLRFVAIMLAVCLYVTIAALPIPPLPKRQVV